MTDKLSELEDILSVSSDQVNELKEMYEEEHLSVTEDENGNEIYVPTKVLVKQLTEMLAASVLGDNLDLPLKDLVTYANWHISRSDYIYELNRGAIGRRGKVVSLFIPQDGWEENDDGKICIMLNEPEEEAKEVTIGNVTIMVPLDTPEFLIKRLESESRKNG